MPEQKVELTIRASSMPTAVKCPGSAALERDSFKSYTPTADLGTAVHEVLERYVSGGDWPDEAAMSQLADIYSIEDFDEFAMLCNNGKSLWDNDLKDWFDGDVLTEQYVERDFPSSGVRITGHIDIIGASAKQKLVRVIDWKTGRVKSDYMPQVMSYAALALSEMPDQNKVEVLVVFVRDKTYARRIVTRSMLAEWMARVVHPTIEDAKAGRYRYGDHCKWCEHYYECPAMQSIFRSLSSAVDAGVELPEQFDGEDAGHLWDFHKAVARLSSDFDTAVKARVDHSPGDEVSLGGDRVLRLVATFTETIDDTLKAWPIVEEYAGEEAMPGIVTIAKGKAVKAARDKAPRGKKKVVEEEMLAKLTDAKAMKVKESQRLQEGKKDA